MKIIYDGRRKEPTLTGFCGADFAGDTDSRESTSGYLFLFGDAPVTWMSKKQVVAQSAREAEYIALAEAGKEAPII